MPLSTGVTCAAPACTVSRSRASRSTMACFQCPQLRLAVAEQREIVHVAQVGRAAQLALDEMIEGIEIAVRPELRGQIADRQAARTAGGEQVVAGKPDHRVLLVQHAGAAGQDRVDQPQHRLVADHLGQAFAQDGVIQRRKVLDDVQAQHVAIAPGELLQPVHRPMRALPHAIGVAVEDEATLERRLDHVAQRVMHHPIPKRRGADFARVWLRG